MNTKLKNVLSQPINSQWPEPPAAGKPHDLQACFRAAGLPHQVTVSPKLAARCGWVDSPPGGVDPYVIAWVCGLVLNGHWLHRQRQTRFGEVLILEFPAFVNARETITLSLGIVVKQDEKLHLVDPEELDESAPKRACILFAEDEPELARLIRILLERAGFTVVAAADGLEAWHRLQGQPFDLALLDVDLPGLTGIQLCQRIRATPRLKELPVIFCSGRVDLAEVAKQAGADDFVQKPLGLSQLVERINQLLGHRQKDSTDR